MAKIYAVKEGREPGIYFSWSDCSKQVDGYSGAEFKSFTDLKSATDYLMGINQVFNKNRGYYAVKRGKIPGIYSTWAECKEQIDGFERPVFKKFFTETEAKEWMGTPKKRPAVAVIKPAETEPIYDKQAVAYIDGSYNSETDVAGYGVVFITDDGDEETTSGKVEALGMHQINGEITAAETATQYAIINNYDHITLYYDYEGIEKWVTGVWKTNKKRTTEYAETMRMFGKNIAIDFKKVSAHTGVELNEKADELAKSACGQ